MQKQKGFTIIELIVVIAIIAVLAAIVMVNVTSYIAKGKDAAIKGNMSQISTTAAAYYESIGNYGSFASNTTANAAFYQAKSSSPASGSAVFTVSTAAASTNAAWCACANLQANSGNTTYCIDSTGYKKEGTGTGCSSRCSASAGATCSD